MPLLFSLGQDSALKAVQEDSFDGEFFFAYLGDTHVATTHHTVGDVYKSADENLWAYSRIRIHGGKTKVLNEIDDRPEFGDTFGGHCSQVRPRCRVLETPLVHPQFVEAHLNRKMAEHEVFLERMPTVPDLQSAWSLFTAHPQG